MLNPTMIQTLPSMSSVQNIPCGAFIQGQRSPINIASKHDMNSFNGCSMLHSANDTTTEVRAHENIDALLHGAKRIYLLQELGKSSCKSTEQRQGW